MATVSDSDQSAGLAEGGPKPETADRAEPRGGLLTTSFAALVVTQFLVAMNDNVFRWLLIPIGKSVVDQKEIVLPGFSKPIGPDFVLAAGAACFLLPFVLLAAPAGYLTDRFSKRNVMIGCKVAEIVIMILGVLVILSGNLYVMLVVLFLMGAQSAMFSPSKYGSIPEIVREDRISAANGVIGMTTMVAIILGSIVGNGLFALTTPPDDGTFAERNLLPGQYRLWISASALVGIAVLGWIASLFIGKLKAANPQRKIPWNPAGQTVRDLRALIANRPLLLAGIGSAYFWALGALAQVNIDKFAQFELRVDQQWVGPLLGLLTLGIGIGSVLAGVLSRGRIELGLVPFGALGIAVFSMLLFFIPEGIGSPQSAPYYLACAGLTVLGMAAGLYDIPLLAFLQHRSPKDSRGRILAAYNFLAFTGMLLASGLFGLMAGWLGLSARQIWLIAGIVTLPVCLVIFWLVFDRVAYLLVGVLLRLLYRTRLVGLENLPKKGGAMLIPNHVTWIDGVLLLYYCPRPVRMLAHPDYLPGRLGRRLARDFDVIPIVPGRRSVVRSIRAAREALRQGDLVCVFPEGGLSRTGGINPFNPGFLTILKGTGVPVIPVYLGGLWGSIFSFERGKWFWKWPRRLPYPVSLRFGRPVHDVTDAHQVRRAVQALETEAMDEAKQATTSLIPPRCFLRTCRKSLRRARVADSTGAELTGAGLLTRTLVLRRILRREVLSADERHVGILLPPSVAGAVANAAVSVDGRVAVNLNYTVSSDVMNACIDRAEIRHVLTSRSVMKKLKLDIEAELVYLEDFRKKARAADKLAAALATWLVPVRWLERGLGLTRIGPDDLLTVVFTSGSTGQPKGVMLTQHNVGANVGAFDRILHIQRDDVLVGILPFFHSFGFTVTLWAVLMLDAKGIYHFSPLEAREVGKLCRKHGATLLIATPTFLRTYVRRCAAEDLASLEVVITGAEKLPGEVADAFEKKFGVRPLEGYGTTELSPVVSCNVPPSRMASEFQLGPKEGTVGQPVPGVAAKIVDLDTGDDLGVDQPGMLLIRGHNVMKGYLGQPELTAEVIRDGWYTTGDVAMIDAEGYIRITGRQSRFSKIGGEMVPHLRVEEVLGQILDLGEEELRVMVTAIPDPRKGERLIILHTGLEKPPEEICRRMADAGLPPLWVPSPDNFVQVDEIPVLGTGKLDLRRARQLAEEKAARK
jgi:acyl-[acyl-carrier-protein]-phospholipid O-acyltransferase/long-chain-fatty-acid--[acyl-carrier-protein] ligase